MSGRLVEVWPRNGFNKIIFYKYMMNGHGNCKCPHHIVAKVFSILSGLSGLGFLYTAWTGMSAGLDANLWFEQAIIFLLLGKGTGMCKCCGPEAGKCGHGGGCGCGDCGMCKVEPGKPMDASKCSHQPGCKCGDCSKCM
jgi:hypothetical protein